MRELSDDAEVTLDIVPRRAARKSEIPTWFSSADAPPSLVCGRPSMIGFGEGGITTLNGAAVRGAEKTPERREAELSTEGGEKTRLDWLVESGDAKE